LAVSKEIDCLKGTKISGYLRCQKNMMVLQAFPQQEFQKYFQQWHHHWAKCTAAEGGYFEGNPSQ
jgi:hypothetical protein